MSIKWPFQSYRFKILLRLMIVVVLAVIACILIINTAFWLLGCWFLLFAIFGIYNLLQLFEAYRRELNNFLTGIRQNDFSHSYSFVAGKNTELDLHYAYTTIIDTFQKLRQEKEQNYHFLQTVVEHSTIAMLVYNETNGNIILYNEAARDMFKRPFLKNIEALHQVSPLLLQMIKSLSSGDRQLINLTIENGYLQLAVNAKELKLEEALYKLISFQNIKNELDQKELEAWQKLIRVLTHEIKNSAIPISTLTEVVGQMIMSESGELKDLTNLSEEDSDDLKIGLKTVEKRSKGLVSFVNAYGQLAKVPHPNFEVIDISKLVNEVALLFKNECLRVKIRLQVNVKPQMLSIDSSLIEQVIINLIKNAKEAVTDVLHAQITITSSIENNQYLLYIQDNGKGMDTELLENIFIPFFTTKKDGSGIGLSLSKQIMVAHRGQILVNSKLGKGTTFMLIFNL